MKIVNMKSKELKNIKPVQKTKSKRILFINPKRKNVMFSFPHNGLAMLGTLLKKRGHEVSIIDYAFLFEDQDTDISYFINRFKPDFIGISIYTPNANEAEALLSKVHDLYPKTPILMGGPHATLYSDLLKDDKRIDYIVKGEAEPVIISLIENAKKEKSPVIVEPTEIVDINDLPYPDYKIFYKWQNMTHYPIMTSRGCPNKCSFCASFGLSYRRWRARSPEDCIKELELAKKEISPHLKIIVFDDNPTVNKKRFHEFLDLYSKRIKSELVIVNTRADGIDEEFLKLAKKCGVQQISLGAEHLHPEVYKYINKGETVEQIEEACRLIKKYKFRLCLSFVIGLPNDNIERTKTNINFLRKIKADHISVSQLNPFKHTTARELLEERNAKLSNEIGYDAQPLTKFECETPIVETPDFTIKEREKAYYMYLLGIADPRLKLKDILRIYSVAKKYGLNSEFFFWFPRGVVTSLKEKRRYLLNAWIIYRTDGFNHLLKRYKILRKQEKLYKLAQKDN